ncbi:SDR family NAD(P)-dependent oxidoreductase [Rhizobium johnstonii]|uniref:Short-chain dehydrogenase/oxidoreductase n=1 Tax=Rhizobium johnstonii (strain DSM 114642 / LMG 32736 / 3841) TaxID=216596 RepID=Q1MM26_RHIJ3|nr:MULTISPECIES: SDR family oxidoreductase [Rhizobium]MBB4506143.1 NAD(P)-dependent dehydrogenase (short-subunit alcohol dehydrogenase family) [Rhizobium leguminosarum]MBY5341848.1 SDR family oxidoreductase [Rhizobium leguminosarum]MBY5375724.1 SDR family oxidoreductase [Rhizobium leguminosarum]MBY5388885.1 SDR family oxidoreductase [Rhizobium leguminosarum]MBY5417515.1 SDR family oxidoreductase [Rhizobium leguminosarum]
MSNILKGKVALVTGGSRGLGAATAEALADQGADVAISYVASAEKAEAVVETLRARGVRALAIQSDQADMAAAKPLVEKVVAYFGKLDILVNNAAIAVQGKTVDDPDLDTVNLDRQWQINVMGAVATTRAAAPVLPDGGRIIFIGSALGTHVPFTGAADYAGTKAAIVGYAKGVARDLGGRNITVNVIQPGVMPTDMAAEVLGDGVPEALMNLHAIRRIATLEEVSALIRHLAGPNGGYITGGVIDVAGGLAI